MSQSKAFSRRQMLVAGTIGGVAAAVFIPRLAEASSDDKANDLAVISRGHYYEQQAIWAYNVAGSKLSNSDVGKAVLAVALANQANHKEHRDLLAQVIVSLGGTPAAPESSYDLSSYINNGEGNLDSDVNIAKLALALETDAAIGYSQEVAKLKTPALVTAGASIGSDEAAHATYIRAAFNTLGVSVPIVPAAFINSDTRSQWILTV